MPPTDPNDQNDDHVNEGGSTLTPPTQDSPAPASPPTDSGVVTPADTGAPAVGPTPTSDDQPAATDSVPSVGGQEQPGAADSIPAPEVRETSVSPDTETKPDGQ